MDMTNPPGTGRTFLNTKLLPRLADELGDSSRVLFVGVHKRWDYKPLFHNPKNLCRFETLDKLPGGGDQPVPDYHMSIENCEGIKDNTFDLIVMIGVYEFLDHKEDAFSEINRILKPGGRAMISVPGKGYYPDNNRALDPWDAWWKMKPLRILEMYITFERAEAPTAIHVLAEKHEKTT